MVESIHVQVKFFGHLRQSSSQTALELEMPVGATVSDLVFALAGTLGENFRKDLLDSKGNLHGGIEVVLNEEHLPARKIASIVLANESMVYFVPMIEGG